MKKTKGRIAPGKSMRTATSLVAAVAAAMFAACSPPSDAPDAPDTPQEAAGTDTSAQPFIVTPTSSFTIGDFAAIALLDGILTVPNDSKVFAVDRSPEEVAELLTAAGLPSDSLTLSCQPLLVKTADGVLLFDTGAGTNFGPTLGGLPDSLAAAGVDAADVTDIFISHSHGDHIGGLVNAAGTLVFPNATIHISAPEWEFIQGMPTESAERAAQLDAFIAAVTPKIAAFEPGADIVPGLVEAVEIEGHTPGHSGYLISSGQESLLYIGDAMHHFVVSVQKPDWTIAFDGDAPTAEASRKALLAQSAETGQRIYAVHFPFPGLGRIEGGEGEYEWVPE